MKKNKLHKLEKISLILTLIGFGGSIIGSVVLYFGTNYVGSEFTRDSNNGEIVSKIKYGYGISNWCYEWDLNNNLITDVADAKRKYWNYDYFSFVKDYKKTINELKKMYQQNPSEETKMLIDAYTGAINAFNLLVSGIVILPIFGILLITNVAIYSFVKSKIVFQK